MNDANEEPTKEESDETSATEMGGMLTHVLVDFIGENTGLEKLRERFHKAGLDQHFDSWVGKGPNIPVTAEQINAVLGDDLDGLANPIGVERQEAARLVAQHLPGAVRAMTPQGRIP